MGHAQFWCGGRGGPFGLATCTCAWGVAPGERQVVLIVPEQAARAHDHVLRGDLADLHVHDVCALAELGHPVARVYEYGVEAPGSRSWTS